MFFHSYFFLILHCLDLSQFIHFYIDEHPGYFQVWAIMKKAAVNIHIQVFM